MNRQAVMAIARKDLTVVAKSRAVMLPLLIVPVLFLIGLPLVAALAPTLINLPGSSDVTALLDQLPEGVSAQFQGLTEEQRIIELLLGYLFAPLYLVVPLMMVSVIAADAFAGEKERRTLEALLYTPTSDAEVLLGKALAAYLPALAVAWGGFVVYVVVANAAAWPVMGRVFLPTVTWWVLASWVAPAVAALGLGSTVLVSARVNSFQEAYQLGAVVVVPIVGLVVAQAAGLVILSPLFALALGAATWLLAGMVGWFGMRVFTRDRLLTSRS